MREEREEEQKRIEGELQRQYEVEMEQYRGTQPYITTLGTDREQLTNRELFKQPKQETETIQKNYGRI